MKAHITAEVEWTGFDRKIDEITDTLNGAFLRFANAYNLYEYLPKEITKIFEGFKTYVDRIQGLGILLGKYASRYENFFKEAKRFEKIKTTKPYGALIGAISRLRNRINEFFKLLRSPKGAFIAKAGTEFTKMQENLLKLPLKFWDILGSHLPRMLTTEEMETRFESLFRDTHEHIISMMEQTTITKEKEISETHEMVESIHQQYEKNSLREMQVMLETIIRMLREGKTTGTDFPTDFKDGQATANTNKGRKIG